MRLRRKPWIDEAIKEYSDFLYLELPVENKGKWKEQFAEPEHPLCVELGTGKGRFISQMAAAHPEWNFVGFERQIGVIYYAGKKVAELDPPVNNVRLVLGDISHIEELFTPGEVDRFFINFCDPWPKARHEKRRLTHRNYLKRYAALLAPEGLWASHRTTVSAAIKRNTRTGISTATMVSVFLFFPIFFSPIQIPFR